MVLIVHRAADRASYASVMAGITVRLFPGWSRVGESSDMLDVPMIQTRGFRNRAAGDGFEVRIRSPYVRL